MLLFWILRLELVWNFLGKSVQISLDQRFVLFCFFLGRIHLFSFIWTMITLMTIFFVPGIWILSVIPHVVLCVNHLVSFSSLLFASYEMNNKYQVENFSKKKYWILFFIEMFQVSRWKFIVYLNIENAKIIH